MRRYSIFDEWRAQRAEKLLRSLPSELADKAIERSGRGEGLMVKGVTRYGYLVVEEVNRKLRPLKVFSFHTPNTPGNEKLSYRMVVEHSDLAVRDMMHLKEVK